MGFYERMEELLKEKKISKRTMEQDLGFSNGLVSKWKVHMPTQDKLQKVSAYLGVPIDYLVCLTDDRNEGHSDNDSKIKMELLIETLNKFGINSTFLDLTEKQDVIKISDEAKLVAVGYDKAPLYIQQTIQNLLKYQQPASLFPAEQDQTK